MSLAPERAWAPDESPRQARRIGKTLEEVNELGAVLARISIQGLDTIEPRSGESNRQRLVNEIADVQAQIACTVLALGLDQDKIGQRTAEKSRSMHVWEAHLGVVSAAPEGGEKAPSTRRVVCAAIRAEDGSLVLGARHYDLGMRAQIHRAGMGRELLCRRGPDQGFVDSDGTYLTREEAYSLAVDAGQLRQGASVCNTPGLLFSEDLY